MKQLKTLVALHILFSISFFSVTAIAVKKAVPKAGVNDDFFIETKNGPTFLLLNDKLQQRRTNSVNLTDPFEASPEVPISKEALFSNVKAERQIRVVVDPGHGGKDFGAQGHHGSIEKEMCLKVSKFIRREVEKFSKTQGYAIEVKLSRDGDEFISLRDRVKMANTWGADLFVSVHAHSSPALKAKGFEVYFLSPEATDEQASQLARLENQAPPTPISAQVISILSDATTQYHVAESSHLAESMFSAVSRHISSNGRGVRQAPFTVLHGTNMPAVLVEIGYITNFEEAKNLVKDTYLKRIAGAISAGIIDFAVQKRR